jgi:hypothetical protein
MQNAKYFNFKNIDTVFNKELYMII